MTRRKAPEQRQRRGTGDLGQLVPVPEVARLPAPPAPRPDKGALLKVTQDQWRAFWDSPVGSLVDRGSDLPALHRLFLLYDERERAERAYRRQRSSTGSTGQLVVNPFAKQVASIDARITQLEDRFGLSPKARLDLGVTLGEAIRSADEISRRVTEVLMASDDDGDDPRLRAIDVSSSGS